MRRLSFIALIATLCLTSVNTFSCPSISLNSSEITAGDNPDKKAQKEEEKQKKAQQKQLAKERKQREKEAIKANAKIKVNINNDDEWINIGDITLNYYYDNLLSPGWQTDSGLLFKHIEKKGAYFVLYKGVKYLAEPYFSQYKWRIKALDGYYYLFNLPSDLEESDKFFNKDQKLESN